VLSSLQRGIVAATGYQHAAVHRIAAIDRNRLYPFG
jgi:hypothetical protein